MNGDKDKYQSWYQFTKYHIKEDQVKRKEKTYDCINEVYPNGSHQY